MPSERGIFYDIIKPVFDNGYRDYLKGKEELWESLCNRCGGCCGAFDDPCNYLKRDHQGKYFCDIYQDRFGIKQTVKGEKFNCVPIKNILHNYWKNDHLCVYKQYIKAPWMKK